jgi:mannosyltransferase OCH1-like enzyme
MILKANVDTQKIGGQLDYLTMHSAAQYVFQKLMTIPYLNKNMFLFKAEDGPFKYLHGANWDHDKAFNNLLNDTTYLTPIIKLRNNERTFVENNQIIKQQLYKQFFDKNIEINTIPKIIHQIAMADKTKWPKEWFDCQETWKKQFPDFEYKMWKDDELGKLIETDYPWFLETFNKYPKKIQRIDIVRCFILDKYGGIYADMDFMCIKNFYNNLPKNKVSISESPSSMEYLMNSLMCSPKKHPFWMKAINKSKNRMENEKNNIKNKSYLESVLYTTGPQLISHTYDENKDDVNVLPLNEYNPYKNSPDFNDDSKLYTKHFCTAMWLVQN